MESPESAAIRDVLADIEDTVNREERSHLLPVWGWRNATEDELRILLTIVGHDQGGVFFGYHNRYSRLKTRAFGLFESVSDKPEVCFSCYNGFLSPARTSGISYGARPYSCGIFPCVVCKRFPDPVAAGAAATQAPGVRMVCVDGRGRFVEIRDSARPQTPLMYSTKEGKQAVTQMPYAEWKARPRSFLAGLHPLLVTRRGVFRNGGYFMTFDEMAGQILTDWERVIRDQHRQDLQL